MDNSFFGFLHFLIFQFNYLKYRAKIPFADK